MWTLKYEFKVVKIFFKSEKTWSLCSVQLTVHLWKNTDITQDLSELS